jgi:hypothetical protein
MRARGMPCAQCTRRQQQAAARAADIEPTITELRASGAQSLRAIAAGLNEPASQRRMAVARGTPSRSRACWRSYRRSATPSSPADRNWVRCIPDEPANGSMAPIFLSPAVSSAPHFPARYFFLGPIRRLTLTSEALFSFWRLATRKNRFY